MYAGRCSKNIHQCSYCFWEVNSFISALLSKEFIQEVNSDSRQDMIRVQDCPSTMQHLSPRPRSKPLLICISYSCSFQQDSELLMDRRMECNSLYIGLQCFPHSPVKSSPTTVSIGFQVEKNDPSLY